MVKSIKGLETKQLNVSSWTVAIPTNRSTFDEKSVHAVFILSCLVLTIAILLVK
jgi:hypothetical protein